MSDDGLVYFVVNKMNIYDFHLYEDCVQTGFVGLIKAKKKFDPKKGFKFSTFAIKCIYNEIAKFLRTEQRYNNVKNLTM